MATEDIFKNVLNNIGEEQQYKDFDLTITPISSGNANFTSSLYLVKISAPDKPDLKLFSKVAAIGEKLREKGMANIFSTEFYFYTKLKKEFEQLYKTFDVPIQYRINVPKFYGGHSIHREEILILEDLFASGYVSFDRFKSLDWNSASAAIVQIANFHAVSLAFIEKNPEEFEKIRVERNTDDMLKEFMPAMEKSFELSLKATNDKYKDRLKQFIDKLQDMEYLKRFSKPLRRPIITHSDYRASNLMYKVKEDGSCEIVVLDFQLIQAGCLVTDLLYLIFSSTDQQFRNQYYEKILEHYYTHLSDTLKYYKLEPNVIYPKEDFYFELKEMLPFGLFISTFMLPLVTVESESAPQVGDMELSDFVIEGNQLYKERFNGAIEDFVKWGVL